MPSKLGGEFLMNTVTTGTQQLYPKVCALTNGNFVAVWQNGFCQIFDSSGTKVGNQITVPPFGTAYTPSIAPLDNGGFVIVSTQRSRDGGSPSDGIYAQIFDSSGTKVGNDFLVNTYVTDDQRTPTVVRLDNGNFVVAWESNLQDGGQYGVYGQIFNSSGQKIGSELQLHAFTTSSQNSISISPLKGGGFVSLWTSNGQDTTNNIYGQIFASSGAKIGAEFLVNTYTADSQTDSSVALLDDGNFVVTWTSNNQDSNLGGIYGQIFNPSGQKVGTEFLVNTYVTSNQQFSSISSLKNGNFIVTWASTGQDGDLGGIYGQVFNSLGTKIGNEFLINTGITNNQVYPSLALLNNGNFLVAWQSSSDTTINIHAQIFYGQTILNSVSQNLAYTEDTARAINTLSILGALNENTVSAKLTLSDPVAGNFSTTTSGSATSTYNVNTGIWQAAGNITEVNNLLNGIVFTPSSNYDKNFTVSVEVSDNANPQVNGTLSMQAVSMNDAPVIINNRLSVTRGDSIILTTTDLSATDVETSNNSLTFHLSNAQYGRFEKVSSPGVSISSFTQQEIINGQIRFVHDGSTFSPAYDVFVRDGAGLTSSTRAANISFIELSSVPAPIGSPSPSPSPASFPPAPTSSNAPVPTSSVPDIIPAPFNLTNSTSMIPSPIIPSSTPAPGVIAPPRPQPPTDTNAIVGGVVGGVFGVAALIGGSIGFWCYHRQKTINKAGNAHAMNQNQPQPKVNVAPPMTPRT